MVELVTDASARTAGDKIMVIRGGSPASVDQSAFATSAQGAKADAADTALTNKTLTKHYSGAGEPGSSQNFAAGYSLLSRGRDTATGISYECIGDGVWRADLLAEDFGAAAFSNLFEDLETPTTVAAAYPVSTFLQRSQQDFVYQDIGGDINTPRPIVQFGTRVIWSGNAGIRPTNALDIDLWEDYPRGVRPTYVFAGTSLEISADLNGFDIRYINTTPCTVELVSSSVASIDINSPTKHMRDGTGAVRIKAGAGTTLNGVSGALWGIVDQWGYAETRRISAETGTAYRIDKTPMVEPLASLATVRGPTGVMTWELIEYEGEDHYEVTLTGVTVSGNLTVTTADVTAKKVLIIGCGPGGTKSTSTGAPGGASGAQVVEQDDVLLAVGDHAFDIGAPGPAVTSGAGGGTAGGSTTFKTTTCVGGENAPQSGNANNGDFHGPGGGSATTNTTDPTGGTGTSGRNGGNGNGTNADVQANRAGGGGAGAGGSGGNATDTGTGGDGGVGFLAYDGERYGCGAPGAGQTAFGTSPTGIENFGSAGLPSIAPTNSGAGKQGAVKVLFLAADLAGEPELV